MQSGKYTVKVVVDGVEQAEQDDGVVALAFGGDYKIRIYGSQDGRRAAANVSIDGVDVTGGGGLVVPAYGYVDLETPVSDPGRTFRFASTESTAAESAGKSGPDTDGSKGLIRVEVFAEKQRPQPQYTPIRQHLNKGGDWGQKISRKASDYTPRGQGIIDTGWSGELAGMTLDCGAAPCSHTMDYLDLDREQPTSRGLQAGITVEGAHSSQRFRTITMDVEETSSATILIKMKGFVHEQAAAKAAPSQTSVNYCSHCGTKLKSLSNRCSSCGKICLRYQCDA